MIIEEYRSVCHGGKIRPFLFTEHTPPKDREPGKVIICQCLDCKRLCSIEKEKA